MTGRIRDFESALSDPDLFLKDPPAFHKANDELAKCRRKLEAAEAEWLELAKDGVVKPPVTGVNPCMAWWHTGRLELKYRARRPIAHSSG